MHSLSVRCQWLPFEVGLDSEICRETRSMMSQSSYDVDLRFNTGEAPDGKLSLTSVGSSTKVVVTKVGNKAA